MKKKKTGISKEKRGRGVFGFFSSESEAAPRDAGEVPFGAAVGASAVPGAGDSFVRGRRVKLISDILVALVGFLFGGCHLVFGAYALGASFVAALPGAVWFGLAGVIVGSLSLGERGVIYALICLLAVLLRLVISGGGHRAERKALFSENILLRTASGVIAGFVGGVYELLLSGFKLTSVAFALSMTILPAVLVPTLSGLFVRGFSPEEILFGGVKIKESVQEREDFELMLFRVSALAFIFLLSLSLVRFSIYGVDLALIFSSVITIFAAKRFGALYGMAVGFISAVAASPLYSVSFALLGLLSGWLFPVGNVYAIAAGIAGLSLFGAYAGEVSGLLSVLPEGLIGGVLISPILRHLSPEVRDEDRESRARQAADMVGTMALNFRSREKYLAEPAEEALFTLAAYLSASGDGREDFVTDASDIASVLKNARKKREKKCEIDEKTTSALEEVLFEVGYTDGVIRAFGEREKYIVLAAEDKDGVIITSPEFKRRLESAVGSRLRTPSFFRRRSMVLMETETAPSFVLKSASATARGDSGEVSGDSFSVFENDCGMTYAMISDGMGSGERAGKTSALALRFFEIMKDSGADVTSLIYMLNGIIMRGAEECAATLDLFLFDRYLGTGAFYKAGSAVSYIKRGSSIFKIGTDSVPIGVMKRVSAEVIKTEVRPGDKIVMMSDGVVGADDDASWLLEYLSGEVGESTLGEFARGLVALAAHNQPAPRDDMTVLVLSVEE